MSDDMLDKIINRNKGILANRVVMKLKDNGEKVVKRIKMLEEERERGGAFFLCLCLSKERPERSDFAGMSDDLLEKNIRSTTNILASMKLKLKLKYNGEKEVKRIKMLEEEKERRRLFPVDVDGPEKMSQSKRQNVTSASGDSTGTMFSSLKPTQSQSRFGAFFNKKLEENRTESRQVNAFEEELGHIGYGGNRNARSYNYKQNSTKGQQNHMMSLKQSPLQRPTKLSVDAKQRDRSNGDQNRHCSNPFFRKLKNTTPAPISNEKRSSPPLSSKALRPQKGLDFVLLDEDEDEPETDLVECIEKPEEIDEELNEELNEEMKNCNIYYPSRDDPESLVINYADMKCLAPQAFLASTIMNFYIRHLQQPRLATERGGNDYHFFNTYFYKKLTEAVSKNDSGSFLKFRRWWKGVDIFQKAYILLPIHESVHWSLVIICIRDMEEDSGPVILHLDSLELHNSRSIFDNVKSFLREEWKHLNEREALRDLPIEEKRIEVPQQRNDYDCGLFVLYFIERFILEAPQRLKRNDLAMFGKNWFKHEDASSLRRKIKKQLIEEFKKARQDNCVPAESTTKAAPEQKLEQSMDITKFILVEADQFSNDY